MRKMSLANYVPILAKICKMSVRCLELVNKDTGAFNPLFGFTGICQKLRQN